MKKAKNKILKNKKKVCLSDTRFLVNEKFYAYLPKFDYNIELCNSSLIESDGMVFNNLFEYTTLYDGSNLEKNEFLVKSVKDVFGDVAEFEADENVERQDNEITSEYCDFIDLKDSQSYREWNESFDKCTLAQSDPLGFEGSEVVETFKGYLEISSAYGIIVNSEYNSKSKIPLVFVTQWHINKYKLRNGDQIMCTCKNHSGNRILKDVLVVNGIPYNQWNGFRKDFKDLGKAPRQEIECCGDFVEDAIKELKMMKGDTTFVYISQDSDVDEVVKALAKCASTSFDNVLYINPNYINHSQRCPQYDNLERFCTGFNESFATQSNISLLGVNHAKRLVELNKRVAIIIDDINTISVLDKDSDGEMPISKNILSCAQNTTAGSINMFVLIPVRPDIISNLKMQDVFRSLETVGWVIKRNSIDLSSSFRTR